MRKLRSPKVMNIELLTYCPYSCAHCYKANLNNNHYMLSISQCEKIIHEAKQIGIKKILLSGGEPLCYPYLENVISMCHEKSIAVCLSTGGYGLTLKKMEDLRASGLDVLYVSLNGSTKEVNENIRDGYDTAINALLLASKCRVTCRINWVAMKSCLNDLKKLMALAENYNVAGIDILKFKPVNKEQEKTESLTYQELILLSDIIKTSKVDIAIESCFAELRHLCGIKIKNEILRGCSGGRYSLTYTAKGYFIPCSHMEGMAAQAISIMDYWQNDSSLQAFVSSDIKSPVCHTCEYTDYCQPCMAVTTHCAFVENLS